MSQLTKNLSNINRTILLGTKIMKTNRQQNTQQTDYKKLSTKNIQLIVTALIITMKTMKTTHSVNYQRITIR